MSDQRADREQRGRVEELQAGERDQRRRRSPSARRWGCPAGAATRNEPTPDEPQASDHADVQDRATPRGEARGTPARRSAATIADREREHAGGATRMPAHVACRAYAHSGPCSSSPRARRGDRARRAPRSATGGVVVLRQDAARRACRRTHVRRLARIRERLQRTSRRSTGNRGHRDIPAARPAAEQVDDHNQPPRCTSDGDGRDHASSTSASQRRKTMYYRRCRSAPTLDRPAFSAAARVGVNTAGRWATTYPNPLRVDGRL